jgi:L-iditol 2-dehydrogenase
MPVVGDDDVLVRITNCGVCGSDVWFYREGEPEWPHIYPFSPGHESAGEVVEVGSAVTSLHVGARVAIEPGIPCRTCEWCVTGKYNLCQNMVFLSAPPYHGAMRRYVAHPASLCFKLPESVATVEGALMEPLAVGLNATVNSGIRIGQSAVILGSGCIGLMTLLSLKAMGVDNVTLVDLFEVRLQKARDFGAAHVINAAETDPVQAVLDLTGGAGADYVFEAAGNAKTLVQTTAMTKRGGTTFLIGSIHGDTPFNFQKMADKEITIQTTFRYRHIYPTAIAAVAAGKIDVSSVVSRTFELERAPDAFEASINEKQSMVKAMIHVAE